MNNMKGNGEKEQRHTILFALLMAVSVLGKTRLVISEPNVPIPINSNLGSCFYLPANCPCETLPTKSMVEEPKVRELRTPFSFTLF